MDIDPNPEPQRCAIYTRKSLELGLDQEFNSLETQRAICSAYIASQRHKAWRELPKHYDDGGWSGATLNRPELQNLLRDVETGLIDTIIVYKLDRITRTLLDFVRLMDFFERYHVAFVSITQNFDTSETMGRLILNVLLTFAQFEREIAADRIRDKQRLIRSTGRWPGGTTPLGYSVRRHVLQINRAEAQRVRFIFERFAELRSLAAVEVECRKYGVKGRRHGNKTGRVFSNQTLCSATISNVLRNPVYIGYLKCGSETVHGLHAPIIGPELWARVQDARSRLKQRRRTNRPYQYNLLSGLLYDCFGRRMGVHRGKVHKGVATEYYASKQNDWGRSQHQAPLWVRADFLERLLVASLQNLLTDKPQLRAGLLKIGCFDASLEELGMRAISAAERLGDLDPRDLKPIVRSLFVRIELSLDRVQAVLRWRELERYIAWDAIGTYRLDSASNSRCTETHLMNVALSSERGARKQLLPIAPREGPLGNRSGPLCRLVRDARSAQQLVEESRTQPVFELARQMRKSECNFLRLLRLNYLAPDIALAILDGTQPPTLTRNMLLQADMPLDWALQRRLFGFTPPSPTRSLTVSEPRWAIGSQRVLGPGPARVRAEALLPS